MSGFSLRKRGEKAAFELSRIQNSSVRLDKDRLFRTICKEVQRLGELSPAHFAKVVREAVNCLFRAVVITGGEPLAYRGFNALCRELGRIDRKGTKLILRSSFGFPITRRQMKLLCETVIDSCSGEGDGFTAGYDGWPEGGSETTYVFTTLHQSLLGG